ncbi:peptidoglycan-binding protein [Phaeobacter sp. HS012]|uniref:peptidoglycan-binding domain-containing protein n=1 Tax=unclassified Phaeobacter TaxID=2621772 RepID=UPI001B393F86|nr:MULTISPECIES: peptidoglycan-binding domain-containing protein [unclassified Phaeobacter]MBQ4808653.1 peptidoglycan-binding protein [Phaeobacter sp. HS012]MBQ4883694.1 peptidoglycan-binding protein [Phaeobacter sp. HS011]
MADLLRPHGPWLGQACFRHDSWRRTSLRLISLVVTGLLLSACADSSTGGNSTQVSRNTPAAPPGAAPGSCWATHTTPAVIETVTVQVMTRPARTAPDGRVIAPARFRRETRQDIVRPRRESWFETPCPVDMTPQLVGSLQRALAVRGLYTGEITGQLDSATRASVRKFQKQDGFDNDQLSLLSARKLGLVAVET